MRNFSEDLIFALTLVVALSSTFIYGISQYDRSITEAHKRSIACRMYYAKTDLDLDRICGKFINFHQKHHD
jgi:hypothetical protein